MAVLPTNPGPGTIPNAPAGVIGPLAALESPSAYDFTSRKYPLDVGSGQRGHYIIFNINVQTGSQYTNLTTPTGSLSNADQIAQQQAAAIQGGTINSISTTLDSGQTLGLTRKTSRVQEAIALYMPDTVVVNYNASFDTPSFTEAGGEALFGLQAGSSIVQGIKNMLKNSSTNVFDRIGQNATAPAGELASNLLGSGTAGQFALFAAGYALNPQLEVMFKTIDFRRFQFDFKFAPQSTEEAAAVREIIKTFKFHMAPELSTTAQGRYFIPPSEFDIEFIQNGSPNPNLHKISTCVLENLDIDNAAAGMWAAFSDGMPAEIRMQLQFREVTLITKDLLLQGF